MVLILNSCINTKTNIRQLIKTQKITVAVLEPRPYESSVRRPTECAKMVLMFVLNYIHIYALLICLNDMQFKSDFNCTRLNATCKLYLNLITIN